MYDSWDVGYLLALPSPAVRFVIVPFAFDFVAVVSWWITSCFAYLAYSPEPQPERERETRETKTKLSSSE